MLQLTDCSAAQAQVKREERQEVEKSAMIRINFNGGIVIAYIFIYKEKLKITLG